MPAIPSQSDIDRALKSGRLPDRFDDAVPCLRDGTAVIEANDVGEVYAPNGEYTRTITAEESQLVDTNPKTRNGATKANVFLIPPVALAHEAAAMEDGVNKGYGPFNWRKDPVSASTYIAALKRHCDLWLDGQEFDPKTGVHHLGAVRANAGILLDAQAQGTLIDDRPPPGQVESVYEVIRQIKIERERAAAEAGEE